MQNPKAIFHCTLPKIVNMGLKIHEKKSVFFSDYVSDVKSVCQSDFRGNI